VPAVPLNRANLAGWQVTFRVTPYNDSLIVGVTFISNAPIREAPEGSGARPDVPAATARVFLSGTGEQVFLAGDLVRSPMTLSGRLPRLENARKVQAEVSIGSVHATLWQPVAGPKS
jgi:hypothetical protein